jgi:tripeptide aminopeptidase
MTEKQLLIDVLSVQTSSGQETMMINYIQEFVKTNVPQATLSIKDNNIYVTKGVAENYPCIVSHTDTVHDIHKDFQVFNNDDILFAFSNDKMKQVGVGGDDKVGVWICLQMLLELDIVKCAFFHSEEVGCVGSGQADMSWFKDVGYVFQSDRRGNNDFVNSIGGKDLFGKDFSDKIAPVLKHHEYKETSGAMTDVEQLVDNGLDVCVANMSSGYYNPHTDSETVDYYDAQNCLDLIYNLIQHLGCERYTNTEFGKIDKNYWRRGYSSWPSEWNVKDDWKESWEDEYGNEVVYEDGEELCYYCGDKVVESISKVDNYRYCKGCRAEVYYDESIYDVDESPTLDKVNNVIDTHY